VRFKKNREMRKKGVVSGGEREKEMRKMEFF
jgi:hypothetical protein